MNHFRLIIYQSLILIAFYYRLVQCEQFKYNFELDSVRIEYMEEEWESILLSKDADSDKYTFDNDQLQQICGGEFSSSEVEIVELFNRAMRFSLKRKTNDYLLFFNVLFSKKNFAQLFFGDIRSQQPQGSDTQIHIEKLFQYQVYETENNKQPLQLLAHHVRLYSKDLNADLFDNPKSFNIANYDSDARSQGAHYLVLLSKTFNISSKVGVNKFVLCSANIPTHRFVLRFPRRIHATDFYEFVEDDLNEEIGCPFEWLSFDLLQEINSR